MEASPQTQFSFPPAQGLLPPAGAESVSVTLTDIVVDGQFPELADTSARLEAARVGRSGSVADVYAFAVELQQAYFQAGFPLARVVVPPQELSADGRVRIVVVDGFIERTDVSHLPPQVRSRVERVLAPLIGQQRPSRAKIERALLVAGDTAGLKLNSTLTPGGETGGTVLVLDGDFDRFTNAVSIDNRVGEELGRWQGTVSAVANSPFGHGERIYALAAVPLDGDMLDANSRRNFVGVGVQAPFGVDGGSWGVSIDYSSTHPEGQVAAQKLQSEYSRVGLNMIYPIIRSRPTNVSAGVSMDFISDVEATKFTGTAVTLSVDRTRVLRFSADASTQFGSGMHVGGSATLSRGIDGLGARSASDADALKPLSRQGADAEFTALEMSLNFATPVLWGNQVAITMRGQTSFNEPLVRSEQFSPSGWDGLSGPPPGSLTGDTGGVARVEFSRAYNLDLAQGGYMAPYAYASSARVTFQKPTILEERSNEASGVGVGMRFGIGRSTRGGYDVTATIEGSHTNSNRDRLDRDWVTAAITARF